MFKTSTFEIVINDYVLPIVKYSFYELRVFKYILKDILNI